ncbi:hypothetical protein [Nostoc sp. TCL26-01]|uniref:hypothetical protein n=1 Tax=Nostoc sp. TCL26-01 TaxID=2576904 RepID=UPI0015BB020E|nr:hypothetical protein [Nostoc sp. TCL26-01]QLE57963.1 hypothetical protein FD725_22065 [Nostoc sp. TCL26-01]
MKSLLKQFTLMLGLTTCVLGSLSLSASADSTAGLILNLTCQGDYTVNIWRRYSSGELLYRATGPLGNLSLGKGVMENTGAAKVYKFKHSNYTYQIVGGRGDHQQQGALEVFKNGRSILSQACSQEG